MLLAAPGGAPATRLRNMATKERRWINNALKTTSPHKVMRDDLCQWRFWHQFGDRETASPVFSAFAKQGVPDTACRFCYNNPNVELDEEDAALWGLLDTTPKEPQRRNDHNEIVGARLNPTPANKHPDDPHAAGQFEARTMRDAEHFPIALHTLNLANDERDSECEITPMMWGVRLLQRKSGRRVVAI